MKRLESLDVLRGVDMFFLVAFGAVLKSLCEAMGWTSAAAQMEHAEWAGFHVYDIIMPLFMFCSGVAIPYAFAKYRGKDAEPRGKAYARIGRRFVTLWVLGMICQGNLLQLEPLWMRWYSNTLQAIAVGYAVSAILFVNCRTRTRLTVALSLLVAYWALMEFVSAGGCGGGSYAPVTNLCEWVDRTVLGVHCDHVYISSDGTWAFKDGYTYTWILSSLNFVVTVLCGVFAGEILRGPYSGKRKTALLVGGGAMMTIAGMLWSLEMPLIKHIWTSSMTVLSGGICFMLMGISYYVIDYKGWKKAGGWALPFGMNAIFAYMIVFFVNFEGIAGRVVGGLRQYMSAQWYEVVLKATACLIFYGLMFFLYRKKAFVKV